MIRIVLRRSLVLFLRLGGIGLGLLLLIEISFGVLGRQSVHIWNLSLFDSVPAEISASGSGTFVLLHESFLTSLPSLLIAFLSTWLVGYGWGILGARLRKWGGAFALRLPFLLIASFPGFWLVLLIAIYSYFVWERPGFADELRVEQGPDLIRWWNASVVALPLIIVGVSQQLRGVLGVLLKHEKQVALPDLILLGYCYEDVFYGQILRRAKIDLLRLADVAVPISLGALVVTEVAFQQDGLGKLFVVGIRNGFVPLVFGSAFVLSMIGAGSMFFRECLVATLEARSR